MRAPFTGQVYGEQAHPGTVSAVGVGRSRPGTNLEATRREQMSTGRNRPGAPVRPRISGKRSSVVSRIADLAELSEARPVPEMGNRGAGLEEALGAAIAARVREFRL